MYVFAECSMTLGWFSYLPLMLCASEKLDLHGLPHHAKMRAFWPALRQFLYKTRHRTMLGLALKLALI